MYPELHSQKIRIGCVAACRVDVAQMCSECAFTQQIHAKKKSIDIDRIEPEGNFRSSSQAATCLPHTVEASLCPFYC